mgnify:CR=1 FL=1
MPPPIFQHTRLLYKNTYTSNKFIVYVCAKDVVIPSKVMRSSVSESLFFMYVFTRINLMRRNFGSYHLNDLS